MKIWKKLIDEKSTENSRSLYETSTKRVWGEYQKKEVKIKKLFVIFANSKLFEQKK